MFLETDCTVSVKEIVTRLTSVKQDLFASPEVQPIRDLLNRLTLTTLSRRFLDVLVED